MITILVVDDQPIVRAGLKQLLRDTPDLVVGGEAGSAAEAMAQLQHRPWDVVVLALGLPDRSGMEVLSYITHLPAAPPVLVLTIFGEAVYGLRLLRMGAAGYLMKSAAPPELLIAIRCVARGGKYLSPALSQRLATAVGRDPAEPRHATLSHREFQVLCLLAAGQSISDIAAELSISVSTVSTHRAHIEKMGLQSTAELIQYALWHRLVPWQPDVIKP
jgi:two-component system, NarL family, invasion response regulator UvrY